MLFQRVTIISLGVVMQYVHGLFAQLAHRMHQPQNEPMHDVGFNLTPVSWAAMLCLFLPRHSPPGHHSRSLSMNIAFDLTDNASLNTWTAHYNHASSGAHSRD